MSPNLDAKLCADFPLLYSARYVNTRHTLSHVGFETGDGWFDISYELSAKLERLIEKLCPEEQNNYYAVQVKEKFGLLNFYMSRAIEEMRSSIEEAEGKSAGNRGNYVAGVGSGLCARPMLPIGDTYSSLNKR